MELRPGIVVDDGAVAAVCARFHVGELWVFGSTARGDFRPNSDIDVLVEFEVGARVSLLDLADLQFELTGLFGVPVDVATRSALRPAIRARVLSEAQRVYAA